MFVDGLIARSRWPVAQANSLLLSILLILSFTACSGNASATTVSNSSANESSHVELNSAALAQNSYADLILAFNGAPVIDRNSLRNMVARTQPGTEVTLISRDNRPQQARLTLAELPSDGNNAANGGSRSSPDRHRRARY